MSTEIGLASKVRNFEELQTLLDSYFSDFSKNSDSIQFYYITSFHTEDFAERLAQVEDRISKFDVSVERLDTSQSRELIRMRFHHEKQKFSTSGSVLFEIDHSNNLIKAISDEGARVIESSMKITDKLYPLFERFFISSNDIIDILTMFVNAGYTGYCTQYTLKKWWSESESPKSAVEYPTDVPLSTILEDISEDPSKAVKMFRGYIHVDGERLLDFYINREGEIRYLDGKYELFDEILTMVSGHAIKEVSQYAGMSQQNGSKEYLEIEFESIVEDEERDDIIGRFRQAIQSERTFSEAVIHGGNPYYHSSLSDREKGSSFELVFFQDGGDFQLEILPSQTFSSLSILKFKRTIFREFGEGDIKRMAVER